MKLPIAASGLTKCYDALVAVDGLTLRVSPGEIYGFLGLNGAGKTTTIRMLLGMIRPSSGEARKPERSCHTWAKQTSSRKSPSRECVMAGSALMRPVNKMLRSSDSQKSSAVCPNAMTLAFIPRAIW